MDQCLHIEKEGKLINNNENKIKKEMTVCKNYFK